MYSLLDFVFPKKCVGCGKVGEYFCKGCFSKIEYLENPVCPICQRQAVGGKTHPGCQTRFEMDGLVAACRYRDPVKMAIKKVKYKWVFDIEKVFVDLIAKNLWKFDIVQNAVLVPVPLHTKRKNWRGFNQAEVLAKNLAQKFKVEYSVSLFRNRETKTQVGLSKDDRKKNVMGAFSLQQLDNTEIRARDIILIDDVYTSGATMQECAKVLKRAGAKSVWGMVVALG